MLLRLQMDQSVDLGMKTHWSLSEAEEMYYQLNDFMKCHDIKPL